MVKSLIVIDECVLGINMYCKSSEESVVVFCIYLPPENSKYGKNNEQTLNKLVLELYQLCDSDYVFICGDFNARIAGKNDCALSAKMPKRFAIDE